MENEVTAYYNMTETGISGFCGSAGQSADRRKMAKGGVKTYEPDRQQPESDRLYTVKPDHGAPPQGCIFKGCRGSDLPG